MEIIPVTDQAGLRKFVELPYQFYKHDPVWIPPLRSEEWKEFDPKSNRMLDHCETALFLAVEGKRVLGRIAAFTDRLALEAWKEPIGLFGSYECVNDPAVSNALLSTARGWLQQKGMKFMRGPWSFATQEWGLVLEGFTPPPVFLAPYNPPYYNDQMTAFGLSKVKDLKVYYADVAEGYQVPERILTLTDRIKEKYGVHTRPINMKNLEEDIIKLVEITNVTLENNWGIYPVTKAEAIQMAHDMKDFVNPEAIIFAEDAEGKPIGFAMSLPDINTLLPGLDGRLFPFGWLKLLTGLKKIRQYRMWALGVLPEYHGKAIDAVLYRATYDALYHLNVRLEINYVLEDNDMMNNALYRLGVKDLRRYRIYQMEI